MCRRLFPKRMNENSKLFALAFIAAARATVGISDIFTLKKIYQKLFDLAETYHDHTVTPWPGKPAKSTKRELMARIESLLDIIEYTQHTNRADAVLLAHAQHSLLKFRVAVLQMPELELFAKPAEDKFAAATEQKPSSKLNQNKKKILTFIKQSPARTKDIVYEFGVLSSRTVKRSLRELIEAGLVKKETRDRGVIYTAAK